MKNWRKIVEILVIALIGVTLAACGKIYHGKPNTGKQIDRVLSKDSFTSLIIETKASDVVVQSGKNYEVRYKGGKKIKPRLENKNGQLIVNQTGDSSGSPIITVTVPKQVKLSQLEVKTAEGDVDISSVKTQAAQLNASEGDISIDGTSLKTGEVDASEGDIKLNNVAAKSGMVIKSSEGDVTASASNFKGYDLSTAEGSISVNGHSYASSTYKKKPHEKNLLKVESEEGDITVK